MALAQPVLRRRGRPPKTAGGYNETREALLRAGLAALTEKGLSNTGIEEVLLAVGVPKGSFYHFFPSKEAFGAEVVERYAAYFAAKLDRHFGNELLSPLNRLKAFVGEAEAGMARYGFARGCLIGNLGQEMAALPPAFREQVTAVFDDWQRRTAACLCAAQEAGEISRRLDPVQLAAYFWMGWEGAVLRAKLERRADPLHLFARTFFDLLPG